MLRRCSALALLAWFGLVLMGSAHAMTAASMPGNGPHAAHAHAQMATSGHAATAEAADMSCGMVFGCHCANLCASFALPHTLDLAHVALPATGHAPIMPSVPTRLLPPPLHPPSV